MSPSPTAGGVADPGQAALRQPQDGSGDNPGRSGSGYRPGGRIAASGCGRVAGEASWWWSCSEDASTADDLDDSRRCMGV